MKRWTHELKAQARPINSAFRGLHLMEQADALTDAEQMRLHTRLTMRAERLGLSVTRRTDGRCFVFLVSR